MILHLRPVAGIDGLPSEPLQIMELIENSKAVPELNTCREVAAQCANVLHSKVAKRAGARRDVKRVRAGRALAAWLMRQNGYTFSRIASALGVCDHTSAIYLVRRAEAIWPPEALSNALTEVHTRSLRAPATAVEGLRLHRRMLADAIRLFTGRIIRVEAALELLDPPKTSKETTP